MTGFRQTGERVVYDGAFITVAVGEFATPEQMGALCVFLCSDAAAQIRGVALPVDGGWTAQ